MLPVAKFMTRVLKNLEQSLRSYKTGEGNLFASRCPEYVTPWEADHERRKMVKCYVQGLRKPALSVSLLMCLGKHDCVERMLLGPQNSAKLHNDIMMFQQHHGESLSKAWTHFKDLLRKVPHHGLDLWLQIQIFYDHVDDTTQKDINYAAGRRLRKLRPDEAWAAIERLASYEDEEWNDALIPDEKLESNTTRFDHLYVSPPRTSGYNKYVPLAGVPSKNTGLNAHIKRKAKRRLKWLDQEVAVYLNGYDPLAYDNVSEFPDE
nr:zinc finger, CCHC-type [Tanacetum cinerariifolium]